MLKRKIRFELCFNEEEYSQLQALCEKTGMCKATVIRYLIMGFAPPQAPPADYPGFIRQLRAIGNNLNQTLVIAKANGILNVPDLRKEILELRELEKEIQKQFRLERRGK